MVDEKQEQQFRHLESDLLGRVQNPQLAFASSDAKRHIRQGFARRLLLMQTNRLAMTNIAPLERKEKLLSYECADLNVHVNSWYVQLRGALDNLAWALHYEWKLLGQGDEKNVRLRRKCDLFGAEFRRAVRTSLPALADVIDRHASWAAGLKELRDPIAHRVPIYAVPGVAFNDDKARFDQLNEEAQAAAAAGDFDTFRDKMWEAQRVGTYFHVFAMSGPGGIQLHRLPAQLALDFTAFLDLATAVVCELETRSGLAGRSGRRWRAAAEPER